MKIWAIILTCIGIAIMTVKANAQDLTYACQLGELIIRLDHAERTGDYDPLADFNDDGINSPADYSAFLASIAEPPPTPPNSSLYGTDWPELATVEYVPPANGNINNVHFTGQFIDAGKFGDRQYGLKFADCTGYLQIRGATLERARQGIAVIMDKKKWTDPSVSIDLIECKIVDNYIHKDPPSLPAQVGVFYSAPAHTKVGIPTLGLYGCVFVNNGIGGEEFRQQYSTMYNHGVYPNGNAHLKMRDTIFIDCSSQANKGIGYDIDYQRCVVLRGAIGFGAGQYRDQQDKTGRHQMQCVIKDNVFYGQGDIPPEDQKLGWGIVTESADIEITGNVFTSPYSMGDSVPVIRTNQSRDYPVNLTLKDNIFNGYDYLIEVEGNAKTSTWSPTVIGENNTISEGMQLARARPNTGGTTDGVHPDVRVVPFVNVFVDVDDIKRRVLRDELRVDQVAEIIRSKLLTSDN